MTREEAEAYAKEMTYRDAVYNALQGKCIPYRKATLIKLYELLDMVEPKESEDMAHWIKDEVQNHIEIKYHCSKCGYGAWGETEKTNYCPNCGTKMEVEE